MLRAHLPSQPAIPLNFTNIKFHSTNYLRYRYSKWLFHCMTSEIGSCVSVSNGYSILTRLKDVTLERDAELLSISCSGTWRADASWRTLSARLLNFHNSTTYECNFTRAYTRPLSSFIVIISDAVTFTRRLRCARDLVCLRCRQAGYTFSLIVPFQVFPRTPLRGLRDTNTRRRVVTTSAGVVVALQKYLPARFNLKRREPRFVARDVCRSHSLSPFR